MESENIQAYRKWLEGFGHGFHSDVKLLQATPEGSGLSLFASQFLPPETCLVSCPESLAITKESSERALIDLLGLSDTAFQGWNERQFQVSYMSLHSIVVPAPKQLIHGPYLSILPTSTHTALYFSRAELESFKGSNLYGATLDRRNAWQEEWKACCQTISAANQEWANLFTWDLYLQSCTLITSRAFPSDLLPTGQTTYPILVPGMDAFNHARDQKVSWIGATPENPTISIVRHSASIVGQELFIDYGAKPNAELILGYGFAVPDNADDTILLRVGGGATEGTTWQVGRAAAGAEGLYQEILHFVSEEYPQGDISYEDHLSASDTLAMMVEGSLNRLPDANAGKDDAIGPSVYLMRRYYLQGQRAIFEDLLKFTKQKETETIVAAQAEGIQLVLEEEEEDDEP